MIEKTITMKVWRVRVLTTTWLSYAGFYFCRKNFSIAKSSILEALEISRSDLAHVFTAYLVAYMLGQFLTGILGRKFAARILLLSGMAISVGCNIVFGFAVLMGPAGYWPFMLFMIVNGFAQATGWPGNIGVLGNWLGRKDRGRLMALWATCYQLGSVFAKSFAALMLSVAGAAWSFWGACFILFGIWIIFYVFERDKPEDVGLDPIIEEVEIEVSPEKAGAINETGLFAGWSKNTIFSVFFMGLCYFAFKFLRYALDSWSPLAGEEMFSLSKSNAGYVSTAFDWVGFLGVLFSGWASDRFFKGRRYQTILLMTVGMFLAFVFLAVFGVQSVLMFGIGLALCGFMLMGPDSLLSGVGAIDVGGRRAAVLAAAIINGLGSIGPIFQEEIIGYTIDNYGYQASFNLLIGVSFFAIFGVAYLALRSKRGLSNL
jgi:OPA family sugar phosphate sensor protein UhpC-like MFS transporter